ncbi:MAG TPA: hypothetical protein PKB14_19700 [Rubrivivax sp.]|nr:hypothetical protein [Rubrivivax sp.]
MKLSALPPVLLAVFALGAVAQTKSLGAAKGGGMLSREQLRACLKQQQELAARKPPLQAARGQLEREREQLDGGEAALNAGREALDKLQESAAGLNRRTQQLSQQIADFNERVRKTQGVGLSGPAQERQQQALDREKAALDKAAKQLDDERSQLGTQAEQAGRAYNDKVEQRNRAGADWNARNAQFKREWQAFDGELQDWRSGCEGRSYREDDERAILSGR